MCCIVGQAWASSAWHGEKSSNKQWHEGGESNNSVGCCFCTYHLCNPSRWGMCTWHVFTLIWSLEPQQLTSFPGLKTGQGYTWIVLKPRPALCHFSLLECWTGPVNDSRKTTSAAAWPARLCFPFCPGLTQPVFFALLFQWHSVLSCLTLCFSFRLLCYLWGTLRVTLRTRLCHIYDPRSFTSWTSISTIPLRFTLGTWLWEIQVYFSNFSQRDYWYSTNTTYLQYDIRIHAYILTDTACVQHVNVGLAQARPNQYSTH